MLRRDRQIRMQIHQLVDACLFAFSFWLAYMLRSDPHVIRFFGLREDLSKFKDIAWLLLVIAPAAPLILEAQGFYDRPGLCLRRTTLWQLFKGCVFTNFVLALALFFFKMLIARWVLIWFGCISFGMVLLKEEAWSMICRSKMALAQYQRRFLLVGTQEETGRIRAQLEELQDSDARIVAELDLNLSSIEDMIKLIHDHSASGVILSAKRSYFDRVEEAIRVCELEGVEAWLVADFFKTQISRTSFDDFCGRPILVFRSTPEASWERVVKQVIDFIGASVLILLSSLVLVVVAVLIRATSPGPILFRQQRSGLNGKPFTIYKFRTMVTDAEQRKHELAAMNEMSGPVFKMTQDPRVTPLGRILRKFSIDEFPQLFNVVRGEMSLVGPRPLPVDEVKRFNDLAHRRRLSVKPGLTCLWQISGRNNVKDFKDWVRLDLEYIDNWSLWLDLKILWRTIPVVLVGTGAK
jgi:exopolysaccharide biosynthesis polyprenyl glycosylphosphotransferase